MLETFCGDGEAFFLRCANTNLRTASMEIVDGEDGNNAKLAKRPKIQRHGSDTSSEVDWLGSNFGAFQLISSCATKAQKHKIENTGNDLQKAPET